MQMHMQMPTIMMILKNQNPFWIAERRSLEYLTLIIIIAINMKKQAMAKQTRYTADNPT